MSAGVKRNERGGNTAYFELSVWYNERTGHIHLAVPRSEWFITTVNNNKASKRGHPNLYRKLARALREAEVPSPDPDAGS